MDDSQRAEKAAKHAQQFRTEFEKTIDELISGVSEEPAEADVAGIEAAAAASVADMIQGVQASHGLREGLQQALVALITLGDMQERCQHMSALQRRSIAAMAVMYTARALFLSSEQGNN